MNIKKILIFVLFFVIIASTTISSVNAITPEQKAEAKQMLKDSPMEWLGDGEVTSIFYSSDEYYDYKLIRVKLNETYVNRHYPVKKDGKYQWKSEINNKIRIFDVTFEKEIYGIEYDYEYVDFNLYSTNQKVVDYEYTPMKNGEWFEVSSSSTKTEYKKGKIYKLTYNTGLRVVNSKTVKKITAVTKKKVIGYYKTYKMPTFAPGKYKWGSFKGNSFTYGNSYVGYYVNHLNDYMYYNSNHRVYKVTPKNTKLLGSYIFNKKPSSFTLYAYA